MYHPVRTASEEGHVNLFPAGEFGDFHVCVHEKLWGCAVHSTWPPSDAISADMWSESKHKLSFKVGRVGFLIIDS